MARRIWKFILLFIIVILILGSLPFLTKKKVDLQELEHEFEKLKHSNSDGVSVRLISEPSEALESRIALIESAQESIDLSYYRINSTDESTQIFLGALLAAADRGVNINLIVDSKFGGLDKKTERLLNSYDNFNVYVYNPINIFDPESIQVSLHNKFMIVDNTSIITGGRNISDDFLKDLTETSSVSYDLDVLVLTKSDKRIVDDFNILFQALIDDQHSVLKTRPANRKTELKLKKVMTHYHNYTWNKDYLKNVDMIEVDNINLLHSSLKPHNKEPYLAEIMYNIALELEGDVVIQTPYAIGDTLILNALESLAEKHKVTMITNSLASSPNYPAFSNYLFHRKKFMNTGIEIYEYMSNGDSSIHSKAYVLGDKVTAIGSMNLDNRSLFINSEQMLLIESKTFQEEYLKKVDEQLALSNVIGPDLKTYKQRYEADVPFLKKVVMKLAGIFLRPFQSLL